MSKKEKLRSEISDEYKWDLTTIYKTDELWQEDFDRAVSLVEDIKKYEDKFLDNGKSFYEFLKEEEKVDRLLSKLYYYANLNNDSDTLDETYKVMINKISDLLTKYSLNTSFVVPRILKLDERELNKLYEEEPLLEEYKFNIENIYRSKSHVLDEEKEKLLSNVARCMNAEDIYQSLIYSDMTFGTIKDEEGNDVELNESNYSVYIRSKDRKVRESAFKTLFNKYASLKNTIAACFSSNVEEDVVSAKIRNHNSSLEASLFDDNVDKKIYLSLIKTVNENLDTLYKYYDLKKELLGLDELHLYDVYVELLEKQSKKYSFEEAKEMVIDSLGILGDEYKSILNKAFDEKWIDVYHNKGKRTGAYSSGFYDTNPFVLLNYEGTLDDVSTLAHELGHSLHTYFSCKNNKYQYSSYKIFVAEVASTVNELLLSNYLLNKSDDKDEKLAVLNHLMETIKGTLFRQTMFAEFELLMHDKREEENVLTENYISSNYYELVKKYFGDNVVIDDEIRYEWERIPHFYYDFYVYKYATCISCACFIVSNILSGKDGAVENYLNFLKLGGSKYPVDELKEVGIDITDEKVIKSAIDMFSKWMDEFKTLINK